MSLLSWHKQILDRDLTLKNLYPSIRLTTGDWNSNYPHPFESHTRLP